MVELVGVLTFVVLLGIFLLWSRRTLISAAIFATLGVTVVALALEMQSRPKPVVMEWRSVETADVLWYELIEGVSITLLLNVNGPKLYVREWSKKEAEELLNAGREAGAGGSIQIRWPFEKTLAVAERLFYAAPQKAPAGKD